jgi:hypothetical protein
MLNRFFMVVFAVLVISVALVGCGGGGGGGTNPAGSESLSASTGTLAGNVTYESQPLADAKIFLYKYDTAHLAAFASSASLRGSLIAQSLGTGYVSETTTNANGEYTLNNIPLGHYTIIAAKGSLQFSQEVEHRAALTPVNAVLTPTGTITGTVQTVKDAVTMPVSGAMVYLDGNSYVAFTGADGVFTMTNVPTNRSFVLKVMPGASGYPTTSPTVTALAGQTVNAGTIALALPVEQTGSISGRVVMTGVTAPDSQLAGTIILLDGPEKYFALTDDNGNYGFIVKTAGAYSVNAVHPELIVTPARHSITVALGATPTVAPDFALSAPPDFRCA